ncbi:MAG: hypothetical protein Q9208_000284 [Pyrenodesmia sp. 3 TL-2023]
MHRIYPLSSTVRRPVLHASVRQQLLSSSKASKSPTSRSFSQSPCIGYPRKDSQDKDSINRESVEYSKSGTDDASAGQEDTAFDPSTTDPGEQKDKVGERTGASDNPLEVSPANHDVSKPRSNTEGGAEASSSSSNDTSARERASGGGKTATYVKKSIGNASLQLGPSNVRLDGDKNEFISGGRNYRIVEIFQEIFSYVVGPGTYDHIKLNEIVDRVKYLLNSASVLSSTLNIHLLDQLFKSPKNIELLCNSTLFQWARRVTSPKTYSTKCSRSLSCGKLYHPHGQRDTNSSPLEKGSSVDPDHDPIADDGESGLSRLASTATIPAGCFPLGLDHVCPEHSMMRKHSAELHCLYGLPMQNLPRSSTKSYHHNLRASKGVKLHPFARSRVYDLRQHTQWSVWGPFHSDGLQKVDWEKVESLMVILWHNVQAFADRYSAHALPLLPPWDKPFHGVTPYSLQLPPRPSKIERPISLSIDSQDPYGVTGIWMRIVCFLDYRELFSFNFSEDQPMTSEPRPPLDTEEAIRFIVIKMQATRIEEPGEEDGKGFPVVHFKGTSTSAIPPVDPNAKSKIRGTVRLTQQGQVRWTSFSVFHGEERWRSEGVQIGGVQSARGVIGFWFDKDFDPYGPAGPTCFWKVSNDPEEESFNMEAF